MCFLMIAKSNEFLTYPALILFFGVALFLTLKLGFIQVWGIRRFMYLITQNVPEKNLKAKSLNPFYALFSAMSSTLGMGNIVGPSMAISIGGPGALFWLLVYIFFGSVTKFTEVTFSVYARTTSRQGDIIGGPAQYLRLISDRLGLWYAALTVILFTIWSSVQVNTLACVWVQESIPSWVAGLIAVTFLLLVVLGGVQRIGFVASRMVPLNFLLYVCFAVLILGSNIAGVVDAIKLVLASAFSYKSVFGGLAGVTFFKAIREGIYKGIFITEAGAGTGSIAHALSDVQNPTDQGILALFGAAADICLCSLSGLVTLVTGVWSSGKLGNTLMYEAFKAYSPLLGKYVFLFSILLFVVAALIGNTYNGSQSFASLVGSRYVYYYYFIAAAIAFSGSLMSMPVLWQCMDVLLALVAFPNLIGLLILSYRYSHVLRVKS